MKVFFSHASEDKPLVEQVFLRVSNKYPKIQGWLDKYEILGGDQLIDKVHAGIESAEKFLIFLSPDSIDKPWVRTELRKALMDEIKGIKPEFIIPIRAGHISQFPPFLEGRFYIDIVSKTEDEWLTDIYSAITREKKQNQAPAENLQISIALAHDDPNAAMVVFEPQFWANEIGFKITTSEKIENSLWTYAGFKGMRQISITELKGDYEYGVKIDDHTIKPKVPFVMGVIFGASGDPRAKVLGVKSWNGEGGESRMSVMHFPD
ncbi:toll/interleukin-1 receptor domain-containing protein [Nitrosomonas communis]|uniref:TIR domain-containing protein n=1 Tax=Nitrosomonas communis TaxID=44574 RepID=A0A1I4WJ55_9PROT|nr:toll/interleukin-1 receptor domain-containing protein [Nitrosomonas communis]SFN13283.1 TIR domain-containing protein [Nitrosomonas communis]